MSNDILTIRCAKAELEARVEVVRQLMRADRRLANVGSITKSSVLRAAIERGLETIEAEYGLAAKR